MEPRTQELWATQNRHPGDRQRFFATVNNAVEVENVLYPGSYLDVAASMVFDDVSYVDSDKRFPKFFDDDAGVREIIDAARDHDGPYTFRSIHGDYSDDQLGLEDESVDLLVSLYAGFITDHCTRYLRLGGTLVVNPGHGDASLASIDDRYELSGVITARDSGYQFTSNNLDSYFVPKRNDPVTAERIRELGKGLAYTKTGFAYLFTRTS